MRYDVYFARGHGVEKNIGNMKYRELIAQFSAQYKSTPNKKDKNAIVERIISSIHGMGGHFYSKSREESINGLGPLWKQVESRSLQKKIKQSLRDLNKGKNPHHCLPNHHRVSSPKSPASIDHLKSQIPPQDIRTSIPDDQLILEYAGEQHKYQFPFMGVSSRTTAKNENNPALCQEDNMMSSFTFDFQSSIDFDDFTMGDKLSENDLLIDDLMHDSLLSFLDE